MMKPSNKINLNINSDDESLNDYIYTWSELGSRPSKISLHGFIDPEKFLKYINSLDVKEISDFTDIIPNNDVSIINQKKFISLVNDIFLTYTHLDKLHEESFISDLVIFYNNSAKEKAESLSEEISEFIIKEEEFTDSTTSNVFLLSLGQNGFELDQFSDSRDYEDIEFFYEESVLKRVKKLIKSIDKEKNGFAIIHGERGCGKTTLLSYISSKLNKKIIFIPCNLIENSINNFEFRIFLKQNPNSLIILDDVELYFNQIYSKSTFFTNNLLQLVDGFFASELNLNIILSLNCDITEIDKNLFESNCLIDTIEVGKLSLKKISELCEYLDKKNKFECDSKIVDVIRKKSINQNNIELGFK